RLKREMNAVSAQDEFARWAKLRRTHDKAVADYEKSSSSVQDTKAKFDKTANVLRWLGTNGMRYLLQFWFSRQALFWLPQGWVPGYVEWLLAFPRAPKGSISIQLWGIACTSVISMSSEAIVAMYVLATKRPDVQTGKQEQEPQAFKSGGAEKKEL
ncbi:protein get1, partial [Aureobasidium melanogenum]